MKWTGLGPGVSCNPQTPVLQEVSLCCAPGLAWAGLAVALHCAASHVSLQSQCHGLPELQHSKQPKSQADLALLDGPQDRVQDGQKRQR